MKQELYQVLLVDDMPDAVKVLRDRLKAFDFLNVLPIQSDPFEARSFITENKIDILFLDMDMPGMDGFTLIQSLPEPPVVIICSGHNSYAYESYDMQAVGYVDKMVGHEKLVRTLKLAVAEVDKRAASRIRKSTTISLRCMETKVMKIIDKAHIYIAEINGKELTVYLKGADNQIEKLQSNITLTELYNQLSLQDFIRIGRSYVIHRKAIEGYTHSKIVIKDLKMKIPVSALDYQELLSFINQAE
ncbi:LytR/AlgR family response regulator transcription factor [Sphingobacterium sp. MYb388]|jgi:DNA-binding LytR/AlgR family response regulator|uniref:LytR/AlgR family response regulator transcription factor n=1 Tax=Sphingobacterium sp. MYb388 TaxID=2745437 RepID=UPI0030B7358C